MRKMKDSGIEWVGPIPNNWYTSRVKFILSKNDGGIWGDDPVEGLDNERVLRSTEQTIDGFWDIQNPAERLISNPKPYRIKAGDLLVTKSSGSASHIGKTTLVTKAEEEKEYLYSNFLQRLHTNEKMNPSFLWYLLNSPISREQFVWRQNATIGIGNINSTDINEIRIPCMSIEEQALIVNVLDSKCAEIDALTADIEKQIETLEQYKRSVITEAITKGLNPDVEMKDSGVQWIGRMPSNWDCIRGKYILKLLSKPVKADDGVITCFRDGEVTLRSNRREEGFTMADKEIGYQGIDVGDLVVHGMDGFAGAIGISDSRGKASPVLNVLDSKQNKRYLMYYLRSMAYSEVFTALASGIRVRSCDLRWNKLAELLYPVPSLSEQNKIVDYLDRKLSETNDIIAEKKKLLDTLSEYKKSLIYEYVTGKKEVS